MKLASLDRQSWLVYLFVLLFRPCTAQAHDPGLSSATIVLGDSRIEVLVGLAIKDAESLSSNNGNPVTLRTSVEFALIKVQLETLTAREFQLRFDDVTAVPEQVIANLKDSQNIDILLTFRRTGAARLRLVSSLFDKLPFGHREFRPRSSWRTAPLSRKRCCRQRTILSKLTCQQAPCQPRPLIRVTRSWLPSCSASSTDGLRSSSFSVRVVGGLPRFTFDCDSNHVFHARPFDHSRARRARYR